MQKYVLGIMMDVDKDIMLLRKTKPEWQAGKYNFPGGKIEENETPEQAIAREFKEETNIDSVYEWSKIVTLTAPTYVMYVYYCYIPMSFDDMGYKSLTEEKIVIFNVRHTLGLHGDVLLPSAKWLLTMSLDPNCRNINMDFPL